MARISVRTSAAALWSTLEILARYGAQIVVTIVLARLLTPGDFGLMAMLLVFTSVGALLTDGGFGTALIQRYHTTPDDETTVFVTTTFVGSAGAVVLWACADPIASFYHQQNLAALTRTMAFVLPIGALGAVPDAVLTKRLDFKSRARAQVIASLVSGALAICLAWRGFGVWSLAIQGLLASGLRSFLVWRLSAWKPQGRFRVASLTGLFGFGGYMLLANLLNTITVRMQSLLLGRLFDAKSLGYFALAQNAQQAPTSFIGGLLTRVGLPTFAAMAGQRGRLREGLRLSLQVSLFLFVPGMIGLAILSKPLIDLIYGERWQAAAPVLSLLALAGALWPMQVLNLSILSAQGYAKRILLLEIQKDAIGISLLFVAAPYGLVGIATATFVASICSTIINARYSRRMLDYGLVQQLCDQRMTAVLTLMAAVPAWAILHWSRAGAVSILTAICVSACVYFAGGILMRHEASTVLWRLAQNLARS